LFDICNLKKIPQKMLGLNLQKSVQSSRIFSYIPNGSRHQHSHIHTSVQTYVILMAIVVQMLNFSPVHMLSVSGITECLRIFSVPDISLLQNPITTYLSEAMLCISNCKVEVLVCKYTCAHTCLSYTHNLIKIWSHS